MSKATGGNNGKAGKTASGGKADSQVRKGSPAPGEMTIRELAERTGMTVRNIRAYQTRGLIAPPLVRGRTGYYNEEHAARIALAREMKADGLNLEAIRRVLDSSDGSAGELFDFTRVLRLPFEDEAPEIIDERELGAPWGVDRLDRKLVKRAEEIGIVRSLPDNKVEVISPRLMQAAVEMAELGVSADDAIATAERLRRHAEGAALALIDLFVKGVWAPFDRAGRPEQDWPKMREALERMRPFASGALLAVFQITMGEASEKVSERTLQLVASEPGKGRPKRASRSSGKGARRSAHQRSKKAGRRRG
jgi:DNA-binding transcriptional MerR regulator